MPPYLPPDWMHVPTANGRLIQLAEEGTVEIADPENEQYGRPDSDRPSRPMLYYRQVPDDRGPLTSPIDDTE